ncbi:MAG: hypothetical protein IJ845_05275 [Bacteroidaceae bacterium]|nr:hypothetical protein [Bacteroidaceae bacterium]
MKIKNIAYCLSLWLIVLLIAACERSHPQVEVVLQQADALMEAHPDSAFSLLDSLHYRQPMSRQETARYALLLANATNKTYRPLLPCDSLLDIALNYYKKNSPDRATALLYKGRLEEEMGQTEKAIELLQEGLLIVQSYSDSSTIEAKKHLLSSLANLYGDAGYYEKSLEAYQNLYKISSKESDKASALAGLAFYYAAIEKPDSAMYYDYEALKHSYLSKDSLLISNLEHNLGLDFYYDDKADSALLHVYKAIKLLPSNYPEELKNYYGTLGEIYHRQGLIDSAIVYLNASIDTLGHRKGQIGTLYNLSEIEKSRGRYASALLYLEKYVNDIDSMYSSEKETAIDKLIHEYDVKAKVQVEKEENRFVRFVIIIIGLLLLSAIIIIYQYILHRNRRKQLLLKNDIEKREQKIDDLSATINENNKVISFLRLTLADSQDEQKRVLYENKINELSKQLESKEKELKMLQVGLFMQTDIYKKIKLYQKQNESKKRTISNNTLSTSEHEELKNILFEFCKNFVNEQKESHPEYTEEDILLICLEEYTDFDTKTIALCFGYTYNQPIIQRRHRMKNK